LALERQDIQKRDFPIARRGYDPDAVDAHLRVVADEVESGQQRSSSASLASAASEQVRSIVEAAETTAADIRSQAEDEARSTRDGARTEAEKTKADAINQSQEHVSQVEDAAKTMLQRVDAMESELSALVESLRTGANRLTADLTLLRGNMGELRGAATGSEEAPEAEAALEEPPVEAPPEPEPEPVAVEELPAAEEEADEGKGPTVEEPTEAEAATPPDDSEGARLIALNMALNGTPRDETDRYLAENFQLADREKLLDEVYARVG
jgi:DivIVA domain-containing protein